MDFPAAHCGHAEVVDVLLQHKADSMMRDSCGKIPLHCCVENAHFRIAQLLTQRDSVHQCHEADLQGRTPLHVALYTLQKHSRHPMKGKAKMLILNLENTVELLYPVSDLQRVDGYGNTAQGLEAAVR